MVSDEQLQVPDVQIQPLFSRTVAITFMVVAVAIAVTAGLFVNMRFTQARTISERQDCARRYSSLLGQKRDVVLFDSAEQSSQLGTALFNQTTKGQRPTDADITRFGVISAMLSRGLDVASGRNGHPKLPTTDQAVDHGMTLDGNHYPPCPKVG
jgi:hypothetical protein